LGLFSNIVNSGDVFRIINQVERTQDRPLASGQLQPFHALSFLAFKLSLGLGILLTFNHESVMLASASLGLVAVYPLMKRVIALPQLFLGLTFNWGALVGITAATQSNEANLYNDGILVVFDSLRSGFNADIALPLYAAGICWTVVYDTIYALQDMSDDKVQKVNSSALWFTANGGVAPWLFGFTTAMGGFLTLTGALNDFGWIYYAAAAGMTSRLAFQVFQATKSTECMTTFNKIFMEQKFLGLLLLGGIVADHMVI